MPTRTATCRYGQLRVTCEGAPLSVCHCLECQKRSGSAFAAQARWPDAQVTLAGRSKIWERVADRQRGRQAEHAKAPATIRPESRVLRNFGVDRADRRPRSNVG